jgi:hypothetical protein
LTAIRSFRRRVLPGLALCGLALLMPPHSAALERIAPTIAELMEESDVIVAGVMPEHGDAAYTIEVSSYLRGRGPRRIETDVYVPNDSLALMSGRAFRFDTPGVFFLRRRDGVLGPTGWQAFSPDRSYVQSLIHIARDPGPFLSSPRWRSNPDVIELVGMRFESFKVTATGAPGLAGWLTSNRIDPFPWSMKGRREIALTTETTSPYRLKGDGTAAGDHLADILNHDPNEWLGYTDGATTPARFTVMFDTRRPTRWGSIGPGAAIDVLEDAVRSRNSWSASPAMWALERLRAEEAVPQVIALLDHADRDVVRRAIGFLTSSRDPRAVRALIALLDRGGEPTTLEETARALTCIGGEAALPVFRIRAGHVQNARYGLGELGTLDDIKILLEDTAGVLQHGDGALRAARARTNAAADTWHNTGIVDNTLEARLWSEWWARHRATLRVVTPPTAALRVRCYDW